MSFSKDPRKIITDIFEGFKSGTKKVCEKTVSCVRENPHIIKRVVAPAIGAVVIAAAALVWSPYTFAVQVTYNGENLGCVSDSSVFDDAMQQLKTELSDQTDFSEAEPEYTVTVVNSNDMTDADHLKNGIACADGSLIEATGLYIDGNLEVVSTSSDSLQDEIDRLVDMYQSQHTNGVAGINNELELSTAYYNTDTVKALSLGRRNLSDLLTVKITCTEVYTNEIAYKTNTITDETKSVGYSEVTTDGVNGVEQVTEEISYVNGVEVSRGVVDTTVISQPVDRTVVIGSKVNYSDDVYASAGGSYFSWPIAEDDFQYISAYWGDNRNHKAIDFAAVYGGKVLASGDGTVTFAGWMDSEYGIVVVIDHGNGYETLYSHCSSVGVSVGDYVTTGQHIAAIGETGRATGPHVHFEVRVNGERYNPAPFLGL